MSRLDGQLFESYERASSLAGEERAKFLAELAAIDPNHAARVRELLQTGTVDVGWGESGMAALREQSSANAGSSSGSGASGGSGGLVTGQDPKGLLTGRSVGGFTIGELIGHGATGSVYKARQSRPSRDVAFKALHPELESSRARRRFEFEAEVLAAVRHPHICSVIAAGFDEELTVPWLATEFVEGAQAITAYCRTKEFPLEDRLSLLLQACEAVSHAHGRGILHRDLKPANILVSTEGELKVIDFGLARAVQGALAQSIVTQAGEVLGTLAYMAPEQCRTDVRGMDIRADVFALGAIAFELACGQRPRNFGDVSLHGAILAVAEAPIPRLRTIDPKISADLEAIVATATAAEPGSRYSSAAELAADLQRYLDHQPVRARPPGRVRLARAWARRNPVLSAVGVIAVIGVCTSAASGVLHMQRLQAESDKARELTKRVTGVLIPAVKKLGASQDAPSVRLIEASAYELSTLVNGPDNFASASLALKTAFDWIKGTGSDLEQGDQWAKIAEESGERAVAVHGEERDDVGVLLADRAMRTSLEARCLRAALLVDLGQEEEAQIKLESLIPMLEENLSIDGTNAVIAGLGELVMRKGDYAAAETYFRRGISRSQRMNDADSELTSQARHYLVTLFLATARWEEALSELDDLLRIQLGAGRANSKWTIRFELDHGRVLVRLGRLAEAEAELVACEDHIAKIVGPNTNMRNSARALISEVISARGGTQTELAQWAPVEIPN